LMGMGPEVFLASEVFFVPFPEVLLLAILLN
jgi:hypothetical protein